MTAFLGKLGSAAIAQAAPLVSTPSLGSAGYGSFGLAMRFRVSVAGLGSLGNWSGCQGLGVNFAPDQVREGGQYEYPVYLPGEMTYGQITLERAMQKDSSRTVRTWLRDVLAKWVNSTDVPYEGETVVITLYDSQGGDTVAEWELSNAVPTAWVGPNLSGQSNEVAVERLQFAHRGFLTPSTGRSRSARMGTSKATLKKPGGESVTFSYNPTSMNIVRGTTFRSEGTLVIPQKHVVDIETLNITVHNLRLEGATQVGQVPTLFSWLQPKATSSDGEGKGHANRAKAQTLEFTVGRGIAYEVTLNRLDVKYTRFSDEGVPIRADVTVTLADAKRKTPRQNPTSGGPPGRRVHTVTEGDNLQRIAQANYADPNAWRGIAAANDIDDPLRMRNGRVLLLPGESG